LLLRRLESARGTRFLAQALNGIHDVLLLRQECVAKVGGPANILIEPLQHVGQYHKALHAGVPSLLCRGVSKFLALKVRMLA